MKATITNLGTVPVPLTSTQGTGLAVSLEPGAAFTLDDDATTVATVGDNPSFEEDLREALGHIYEVAIKLITFWKAHPKPKGAQGHPLVKIRIIAGEGNALRVTGDDKNLDHEVVQGSTYDATMKDYVEIRQLGVAPGNPNSSQLEAP